MLLQGQASFAPLAAIPFITIAQVIASAAMFAFYFRLQAVGGPVYLSQIGYVGAGVGLLSGTLLLGERYQMHDLGGGGGDCGWGRDDDEGAGEKRLHLLDSPSPGLLRKLSSPRGGEGEERRPRLSPLPRGERTVLRSEDR